MMNLFRSRPEAACPANDLTVPASLRPRGDSYVRIDNREYPLQCWSPLGFTLSPYDGFLIRRQKARVTMVVSAFHDPEGPLEVSGEVLVDAAENGILSARWLRLPRYKVDAMAKYFAAKAIA